LLDVKKSGGAWVWGWPHPSREPGEQRWGCYAFLKKRNRPGGRRRGSRQSSKEGPVTISFYNNKKKRKKKRKKEKVAEAHSLYPGEPASGRDIEVRMTHTGNNRRPSSHPS